MTDKCDPAILAAKKLLDSWIMADHSCRGATPTEHKEDVALIASIIREAYAEQTAEIERMRESSKQAYDMAHKYRRMYSALSIPASYLVGFVLNDCGPSNPWAAKIREKVQGIQDAIMAIKEAEAAEVLLVSKQYSVNS